MKLKEIISVILTPDGVDSKDALDMEVEFDTIGKYGLTLLSSYEDKDKILIDIGSSDEKNLTLREVTESIIEATVDPDGANNKEALNMEVEFNTSEDDGLSLLSVYEEGGTILIDIGTIEDAEENPVMSGY